MTLFFLTALAALGALASATATPEKRGCYVGPPNVGIRNQIYCVAVSMNVNSNVSRPPSPCTPEG